MYNTNDIRFTQYSVMTVTTITCRYPYNVHLYCLPCHGGEGFAHHGIHCLSALQIISNNYIINSRIYISITYLSFTANTATITGGQIAGISVGILVIVIVIPTVFALFAVLYCLRRKKLRGSNRMTSQLHATNASNPQSSTWDHSQNTVAPVYYTKTPTGLHPPPPMYNDVVKVNMHI